MAIDYNLDLENVPQELKLIMKFIQLEGNEEEMDWDFDNDFDWDEFEQLLIHHRLFPVMYTKIDKLESVIPNRIIQRIRMLCERNTFNMLSLSAEMEAICKLFTSEQIPLLVLKGPTLGHDLYGDISLRTSSDLDVLIPLDQLQVAESLLVEQGYQKDDYFDTVLNDWKWRHHHITFFHPNNHIKVEVHWRLHPGPGKEPSFKKLWSRKREISLSNYPIYTLKKEDLLLYLMTHGGRHGWSRLRWLLDIHQLVKQNINWQEMKYLTKKYYADRVAGQCFILMINLFQVMDNKELYFFMNKRNKRLAQQAIFYLENKINLHTDPVPADVSSYHQRHLFSLMSYQQRVIFMLSFFYPYPEDIKVLPLPKRLHFLYFPLRPFLWILRKTKEYYVLP